MRSFHCFTDQVGGEKNEICPNHHLLVVYNRNTVTSVNSPRRNPSGDWSWEAAWALRTSNSSASWTHVMCQVVVRLEKKPWRKTWWVSFLVSFRKFGAYYTGNLKWKIMNFEPPSAAASSARVSDAEQRHHVECAEPAAAQLLELSLPLSPKRAKQLRVVMYPTICMVLPNIHFHTR